MLRVVCHNNAVFHQGNGEHPALADTFVVVEKSRGDLAADRIEFDMAGTAESDLVIELANPAPAAGAYSTRPSKVS